MKLPFFHIRSLCSTSWKLPVALQFPFLFLFLLENPSLTTISTCFQTVMNRFFFEIHCHGFVTVTPFITTQSWILSLHFHPNFLPCQESGPLSSVSQSQICWQDQNAKKYMNQGSKTWNILMENTVLTSFFSSLWASLG